MALAAWPVIVDDDGTGQTGTVINKAVTDAIRASIETFACSGTNPTVTGAAIIDEVVAARGNKASLTARLNGVIDADGALVPQSSLLSMTDAQGILGATNLLPNDTFLLWSQGDALPPDYWTLGGAGATIARTGTGLGDATVPKVGSWAAKLTYGGATAQLSNPVVGVVGPAAQLAPVLGGMKIGWGAWVLANSPNRARLTVDDGVAPQYSVYHSGSGLWEWLAPAVTMTLAAGLNKLVLRCLMEGAGSAYFSGPVLALSNVIPSRWMPSPGYYHQYEFTQITGALGVGAKQRVIPMHRPGLVKDVFGRVETAPTVTAIILDFTTWDAAAFTSMFTVGGRPQIAAAAKNGGAQPNSATYARRCLAESINATIPAGSMVGLDIAQVGGGVAGSDLTAGFRAYHFNPPLEQFADA